MPLIHLQGRLICATPEDRRLVLAHLPLHIRLSLREPGCLFFDLAQTADPNIWTVNEAFTTIEAFEAHQRRAGASDWGRATRRIRRDYTLTTVTPEIAAERPDDLRALFLLARMAHGRPDEAMLLEALRGAGALALSLVARFNRAYIGHLFCARLPGKPLCWLLGPASVRASCRGQGMGSRLMQAAIATARNEGVAALFALEPPGRPTGGGLHRFGFVPAAGGLSEPALPAEMRLTMLRLGDQTLPAGPLALPQPFSDYITNRMA